MPYKDPEKNAECKRQWSKDNLWYSREYYKKHKAKHNKHVLRWKVANLDKFNAYRRKWRKENQERFYGYSLQKLYGISLEDYKAMLAKQKGKCAICRKPPKIRLHVDHDHKTGKVRGLLCQICNLRVGTLESFGLVKKAIAYLEKNK